MAARMGIYHRPCQPACSMYKEAENEVHVGSRIRRCASKGISSCGARLDIVRMSARSCDLENKNPPSHLRAKHVSACGASRIPWRTASGIQ